MKTNNATEWFYALSGAALVTLFFIGVLQLVLIRSAVENISVTMAKTEVKLDMVNTKLDRVDASLDRVNNKLDKLIEKVEILTIKTEAGK